MDLQTDGRAFITNDAQIDPGSFDILSNYFGAYEGTGMIGLTLGLSPFATSSNGNVDVIPLSPAQWSGEIDVIYAYSVPRAIIDRDAPGRHSCSPAWPGAGRNGRGLAGSPRIVIR